MRQSRRALKRSAYLRALGAAMRARRAHLGLTIVDIAARLDKSPVAVERLEAGARNVTVLQLALIARALEISLPQLLSLAERGLLPAARPQRRARPKPDRKR